LDIVLSSDKIGEGGKLLEDGKECVPNVVVEGGFVSFGESAREQVVPVAVDGFLTERTWR
jgi:hypothetical protein